jgi:hypothetical protein
MIPFDPDGTLGKSLKLSADLGRESIEFQVPSAEFRVASAEWKEGSEKRKESTCPGGHRQA